LPDETMTRKACIIGHPVDHSRSPLIHGYWLRLHGIDGFYGREDVPPAALAGFLHGFAARGYIGANVTVPNKEGAYAAVARRSETARALGAVNTLWFEDGALVGDNTDVGGFLAHLDASAPDWDRRTRKAVVLGAGGAARAVVHAILSRGVPAILVLNRGHDRAETLAEHFGPRVGVGDWGERAAALAGANLLVNTTSLGMHGQPPLAIELSGLDDGASVVDLVYVPLETPLLAAARSRGLNPVDGLGMLLHQAVPGFERWFGTRPVVTPQLRALIVADIEKPAA
jgi:shikimate dehydrogenase